MKAIASIWSRYFFLFSLSWCPLLTPSQKPDHIYTHSLPEQPMPLEHLSGNQARHVFLFFFFLFPPIMSGRGDCVHISVHCSFPLTHHCPTHSLTHHNNHHTSSCQNSQFLPFPGFPILFAHNRQRYKPHRRSSSNTTQPLLTPLSLQIHCSVLNTNFFNYFFFLRRVGWGGCLDQLS